MLGQPEIKILPVDYHLVNASGRAVRLNPGRSYTIGRDTSCDIRITDALLSRVHCRLDWGADTQWSISDMKSRNGTFVNDVLVSGLRRLHDKDQIRLGGQLLTLYYVQLGADASSVAWNRKPMTSQETLDLADAYRSKEVCNAAMVGSLETTALSSLLAMLKSNRATGRLIFDEVEDRSLWLVGGEPFHALFEGKEGKEAVMSIIRHARTFAFYDGEALPMGASPNLTVEEDDQMQLLPTGRIRRTTRVIHGTQPLPPLDE